MESTPISKSKKTTKNRNYKKSKTENSEMDYEAAAHSILLEKYLAMCSLNFIEEEASKLLEEDHRKKKILIKKVRSKKITKFKRPLLIDTEMDNEENDPGEKPTPTFAILSKSKENKRETISYKNPE